jgi:hypothetical protein
MFGIAFKRLKSTFKIKKACLKKMYSFGKKIREKYKISPYGLLDLQFTPCGIKMNSKVPVVCRKNNLVLTVKLHPLT